MNEKVKGITLIALVITVIVMLIIAGVAISAITTNGVPFGKMQEAANKYNDVAMQEANMINNILSLLDEDVNSMPQVEVGEKADENSTINGQEGTYQNPIIPAGFKAIDTKEAKWGSKDGWNNGLVIQDAVEDSETIGSEFVWVPLNLTLTDEISNKLDKGIDLTVEEIGEVWTRKAWKDSTSTSTQDTLADYHTEPYSYNGNTGYPTEESDYIAMATSVLKNGGFYVGRYEGGTEIARTAASNPTSTLLSKANLYPYNWISWGKSMSDTGEYNIGSKGAVELCKETYTGKPEYGVVSNLIYGVQWDSIMEWIEDERNVSNSDWGNYDTARFIIPAGTEFYDSKNQSAGWQVASEDTLKTGRYLLKTGVYATTKTDDITNEKGMVKNIYDLAGNVQEWTMEAYKASTRNCRGGGFNQVHYFAPASRYCKKLHEK